MTSASAARIPDGSRTVNLDGAYVVPGFWDMHVHRTAGAWFDSLAPYPEARAAAFTYFRAFFLVHGVTGIRELGGDFAALRAADSAAQKEDLPRPRAVLTGGRVGERRAVDGAPHPIRSEDDALKAVEALSRAGAAHVKLAPGLPPHLVRATLQACRQFSVPCVGHATAGLPIVEASGLGLRNLEHLFFLPEQTSWLSAAQVEAWKSERDAPTIFQRVLYKLRLRQRPPDIIDTVVVTHHGAKGMALFRTLAENGMWITPTLTLADGLTRVGLRDTLARNSRYQIDPLPLPFTNESRTPAGLASAARLEELEHRLVREMRAAGVGILAGSDTPVHTVPGASLLGELVLLHRAGLTPAEALRTATTEPARYFRATDSLGSVRPGRVADLVVLRADPLVDVRNIRAIEMVVTNGRVLRRGELDRLLDEGIQALQQVRTTLDAPYAGSNGGKFR